jgi:hypothetical protein
VPVNSCGAVVCQLATDLSQCSLELAQRLISADELSVQSGVGMYYGQLVVLGPKEYHVSGDGWQAVGTSNDKFVLKRKLVANGLKLVESSTTSSEEYVASSVVNEVDKLIVGSRNPCNSGSVIDDDLDTLPALLHSVSVTSSVCRGYPFSHVGGIGGTFAQDSGELSTSVYSATSLEAPFTAASVPKAEPIARRFHPEVPFLPSPSVDSPMQASLSLTYIPDPTRDIFQIGRSDEPGVNDFVCKGPLHDDVHGVSCGTVSRVACRIVCDRLPPYRCHIYASGFSASEVRSPCVLCWMGFVYTILLL